MGEISMPHPAREFSREHRLMNFFYCTFYVRVQLFSNMDLINYEIVPNGYGQIRFFPLWLANQTNTLLEEWFWSAPVELWTV